MVRAYTADDYKFVVEWMESRALDPLPKDLIPEIGGIVDGIAVGFIYKTDSKMAYMEHYISNPFAESHSRKQAMQMVTAYLIKQARDAGFRYLYASSDKTTICTLAKENGFKYIGNQLAFLKELI